MSLLNVTPLAEKAKRYAWFAGAVSRLRLETDEALASGVGVPEEPGGWWHQYVCPTHGTELQFDPRETDAETFFCPHGCVLEGDEYRGAWLVFKHQERARTALSAAALYAATGEAGYAASANAILEAYATQYPRYPVHPDAQPWMLKGKAFHQALTEAIWATTLLRAVLLLQDYEALIVDARKLMQFCGLLENSMADYRSILIHERNEPANNYTAWLNACLACVYAAQGRADKMERLLADKGGVQHHLTIGVLPDQMEFEGSTYYHLFVLRAYWIAVEMAERLGFQTEDWRGEQGQTYRGMLDAVVGLSAPNGELPALHDGPYSRVPFARETAEVFEIGFSRYRDARYVPILREAYRQVGGSPERHGLEAVLYGEGEWPPHPGAAEPSRLYGSAGFAVLRHPDNPLSVLADYGPHGGSHGHDDKLSIVMMHGSGFVLPERGMVPYGSALRKAWFARTPSHNTVSVGGRTQAPHEGECVAFIAEAAYTYAWLRSEGAYEGAVLDRHLWVNRDIVLDWFEVRLAQDDTIDYWLHFLHPLNTDTAEDEASWISCGEWELAGADEAYTYIRPLRLREGSGAVALASGEEGSRVKAALLPAAGAKVCRFEAPGLSVDPSRPLDGVVQRVTGKAARFVAVFTAGDAPLTVTQAGDCAAAVACGGRTFQFRITEEGLRMEEEKE